MNTKDRLAKSVFLATALMSFAVSGIGQTTVNFPYTGGPQNWTVPTCVTSITITAEGAEGGSIAGASGGDGAVVTATIPVTAGDVIQLLIGGQPTGAAPGYNGGGIGFNSTDGNPNYGSAGGGGSTNVLVNGVPYIIAAGGGGAGGGSDNFNGGGSGGCVTGAAGVNTYGAGGGGGTQTAPGGGGAPWAGVPPGGSAGVMGTGGAGGQWQTAPGGGGGGGYFGGGGGGNDGCCTGANGGGGGGGGSSLVPAGGGCVQGANTGNGSVTISYSGSSPVATISDVLICEGDNVTLTLTGATGTIQWQTAPTVAGPWVNIPGAIATPYTTTALFADACFRAEETGGTCSLTPYSNEVCVAVSPAPAPNAGLDDSICHVTGPGLGYVLQGVASGTGTTTWSMYQGPVGAPSTPVAGFSPTPANINANAFVNHPGLYSYILTETDPTGVCPPGKDTVQIFYAKENHTTTFTNPLCADSSNGSITVTSTGNLGAVEYSFDGGATFGPSNTSGLILPEGTYTVISRDAVGCTFQSTVTLTDPAQVVVNVSNDTTVCQNGTAVVSASATGGTTYLYHWSMTASTASSQSISPTVPTTVSVYAENEFGCISTPLDINIDLYAPITVTISPNDTVCPGYPSNHAVTATGGHLGYTYAWTANGTAMAGGLSTADVNPLSQTAYCVTVGDGCETTPQVICTNTLMREVPNPLFTSDTTGGCAPTEIEFMNLTTLMAPAYIDSVTWNIGGVIYHDIPGMIHEFTEIGTYDIYLEVYSNFGCHNSITVDDYITIHPNPVAMFYANPNPTSVFNTEVDFNNTSTPGNNSYQWTFTGGNPVSSVDDSPTVEYPEGMVGQYPVELIVINEFTCSDTIEGIVDVQSDILIFVPNAFTPDGDEFNEYWRVYIDGIDIYDFHLTVFNRWGEIVWESYNPEGMWDGRYGSTESKTGTYVWVIEAKDRFSDKKLEWRGHVTVLK
jgi:gliding motility-associated-like protein